jgi:hypothetical protein
MKYADGLQLELKVDKFCKWNQKELHETHSNSSDQKRFNETVKQGALFGEN